MAHNNQSTGRLSVNPVALSSYAVAICSFAGALLGLLSSHFPSGGLAAVGGFYLVVGLFSRTPAALLQTTDITGKTSGAENLVVEAKAGNREIAMPAASQRELATAAR